MDLHMMHPDLAAQAQAGAAQQAQGVVPGASMHGTQQQQQQQPSQIPHGGYHAALQPSHQPSQQQQQQQQQQQHHQHQYRLPILLLRVLGHRPPAAPVGRLGHVLHTMQQTGFHAWGFVIYRGCAYADEAAWQRFLMHMRQEVHNALAATPRLGGGGVDTSGRQLAPYLEWTVVEDPSLEGASKDTVRRHFAAWAAARTPQRDGPGADGPFIESHVPRFMYCVYIDQRCLRTLAAFDDWLRLDRNGPMQYLACIIIDKNCPPHGEGDAGMMPVDGCERYYTGWMYAHVGSLPELYNTLGHQRLISGPNNYARPPRIYPGHLYGASVPP
ncbi:hypothetical protein LEL_02905 [Akanthomyces lecanii RCEF 1005]|uniref:Uncharacterized protein n=1 Tax=Akanthomyces lecanii RCEF 1005 TaxID=1081108 RepID=A0A168ILZ4_CORDF|nr:hypothetical protein LEL_02905 [Akanthomyces lecanii RCEF 1005]